jgi:hypothetical protein
LHPSSAPADREVIRGPAGARPTIRTIPIVERIPHLGKVEHEASDWVFAVDRVDVCKSLRLTVAAVDSNGAAAGIYKPA